MQNILPIRAPLHEHTRMISLSKSDRITAAEIGTLLLLGAIAAVLSTVVKLHLQIPGHAILRIVLPATLGLALVPRRGAGSIFSISAIGFSALLYPIGLPLGATFIIGIKAATSLLMIGIFSDLLLAKAKKGWQIYLALIVAAILANCAALGMRFAVTFFGNEVFKEKALMTYPVSGLLAGLVSAAIWFRLTEKKQAKTGTA